MRLSNLYLTTKAKRADFCPAGRGTKQGFAPAGGYSLNLTSNMMITSIILKPLKNSGTELNFLPMANYVQQ